MRFISLGFACRVRESIDRFNSFRSETNFFDWLLSNFITVVFIIQNINNPERFLTNNKFEKFQPSSNNLTHYTVKHTQLFFESLHDFPVNINYDECMVNFLEKYKRRLERLKNIIINGNEVIHFIHMIPFTSMIPSIENIYYFITGIQNINPKCKFYLHLLIPPDLHTNDEQINKLQICHNVKIHYMLSIDPSQPKNEQQLDLNWNDTYNFIKNNCL
jgi:hypothetical protein